MFHNPNVSRCLQLLYFPIFCILLLTSPSRLQAEANSETHWSINSGQCFLVLDRDENAIWISKIGFGDDAALKPTNRKLIELKVGGDSIEPKDLEIKAVQTIVPKEGHDSIEIVLVEPKSKLEIQVRFASTGTEGVFTSEVTLRNPSDQPITVDGCTSFYFPWSDTAVTLNYLDGKGGNERILESTSLASEPFQLNNDKRGRSTPVRSHWWSLYLKDCGLSCTAQFAYSGNWYATFTPHGAKQGTVEYGMVFDNEGALHLKPKSHFRLPTAIFAITRGDDLSAAVIAHHRYQREAIIPKQKSNDPLLVEYNTWYAFGDKINAEKILKIVPLAKQIGCEAFVIDANWHYSPGVDAKDWSNNLGDWAVNPDLFPKGLEEVATAVHDAGMKFGIWFEPEVASLKSNVLKDHPDWFLSKDGKPIISGKRAHLDYAKPEVREHMFKLMSKLIQDNHLDWVKLDYNINIGNDFDAAGDFQTNTRLHDHLQGYFQFLDQLAAAFPDLIIENCSSGARRCDPAILAHTHTGWISDAVNARYSPQIAYGALLEYAPEVCNHWMIGDLPPKKRGGVGSIDSTDPEWWDFMFRIAMHGQFGVSSRLDLWPQALLTRATENIELYKHFREVIHGSDVYHLSKAPEMGYNPTGWMAMEYVTPDQSKAVLLAFRLGKSKPTWREKLRGLKPESTYEIRVDGKPKGKQSGEVLMSKGYSIELKKEWTSQVVELTEAK